MTQISPAIASIGNSNLSAISPNEILSFDARVSSIPGIVKLTLGEPDFTVDATLQRAAITSIELNESHYTSPSGTTALRDAIAAFLKNRYQLSYDPTSEIVATVGATEAIFSVLMALLNQGDEVLIPTPTFPLYEADALILGAVPISINTADDNFVLTPQRLQQALEEHPQAKVLIFNYPSNPTGVTYTREQLQALAQVVRDKPVVVIADEIYSELLYEKEHTSIAEFLPGQTVLLNGVSKSHAMTGYRVGFIAAPQALVQRILLPHTFSVTCLPGPMMAAATAALSTPAGEQATAAMRCEYKERRDFLVNSLQQLGFEVAQPQGAFYVFAKIPACCGTDDVAFAEALATNGGVALIAGRHFGSGGQGYVRMSYATSMDVLQEAVRRIGLFLQECKSL